MKNEIAVVICNYNGKKYLQKCIDSIFESDINAYDVFLVDNASIDGSVEFVSSNYSKVNIIRNAENLGGAGGFQTGFMHALNMGYKYILAMDNDAYVARDTLRNLYEYLKHHPDVGMAAAKIMCREDPDKIIDYDGKLDFSTLKVDMQWWMKPDCKEAENVVDTEFAPTTTSLISRDALIASGGMDAGYFIYLDDIEMSYKIKLNGFRVVSVGYAKAWHKTGNSREVSPTTFGQYYFHRNRYYFFSKYAKENELDDVVEYILKENYSIFKDTIDTGYPAAFITQKYILEDFINGVRGKAGWGRILKRNYTPNHGMKMPEDDATGYAFFRQIYFDRLMERVMKTREEMKNTNVPIISVVIPVYGTTKYLSECLESVINQSYKRFQVICVEHGLSDEGKLLLNDYSKKDSRIVVVHSVENGYGNAINLGIKSADGEYITFIKSSDYIEKNMLESLHKIMMQTHADVIRPDCNTIREIDGIQRLHYESLGTESSEGSLYRRVLASEEMPVEVLVERYTWFCLFRKDFINKNDICCYGGIDSMYKAKSIWIQTIIRAEKIFFLDEALYNCRVFDEEIKLLNKEELVAEWEELHLIESKFEQISEKSQECINRLGYYTIINGFRSLHWTDCKDKKWAAERLLDEFCRLIPNTVKNDSEVVSGFLAKIVEYPNYIIYGAGKWANKLLQALKREGLEQRIAFFAVTSEDGNPEEIEGIPVHVLPEKIIDKNVAVIIAVKDAVGIEEKVRSIGINHVLHYKDLLVDNTSLLNGDGVRKAF